MHLMTSPSKDEFDAFRRQVEGDPRVDAQKYRELLESAFRPEKQDGSPEAAYGLVLASGAGLRAMPETQLKR